jgi:hypothetical protein
MAIDSIVSQSGSVRPDSALAIVCRLTGGSIFRARAS